MAGYGQLGRKVSTSIGSFFSPDARQAGEMAGLQQIALAEQIEQGRAKAAADQQALELKRQEAQLKTPEASRNRVMQFFQVPTDNAPDVERWQRTGQTGFAGFDAPLAPDQQGPTAVKAPEWAAPEKLGQMGQFFAADQAVQAGSAKSVPEYFKGFADQAEAELTRLAASGELPATEVARRFYAMKGGAPHSAHEWGVVDNISGQVDTNNPAAEALARTRTQQAADNLIVLGPDGKPMINQLALDAKKQVASAGATNVSYGAPVEGIGPDGKPVFFQPSKGGGAPSLIPGVRPNDVKGKDLTESQAKATTFLGQMRSATQELSAIGADQTALSTQAETALAGGAMNAVIGQKAQRIRQAQDQWAEAFLRFKTGAASTPAEVQANRATFFPRVGDKPEQVEQKKRMRAQAERDMEVAAGRGTAQLDAREPATVPPAARQVVRTGMLNGRKVVQYSDGTTDYAN